MKILKFNENNRVSFNDFEEMEKIRRDIIKLKIKYNDYFDKITPILVNFIEENGEDLGVDIEMGFTIEDMRLVSNNKGFKENDYLEIFYRDVENRYDEDPDPMILTKDDINQFLIYLEAKKYNL